MIIDIQTMKTLVSYHRWAQEKLFRKAKKIPANLLAGDSSLSRGNILATLIHVVDTQWYWRSACEYGELPSKQLSIDDYPAVEPIANYWQTDQAKLERYVGSLKKSDLSKQIEYTWPRARPRSKTLWHILFHIINHAVHHRAEIGQRMAAIGYSPGDMDYIIYVKKMASSSK